ncbi:MAG: hypothetical protein WD904_00940 [Dehalococcoidia bacterium]
MQDHTKGASDEVPLPPPAHMVACAIADAADTQRAVTQLNENGLSEDSVTVLHGKEGADALRNRRSDAGRLHAFLVRFDELASGIDDLVHGHIDAADRGEHVILVALPNGDPDTAERIWHILASHNAHDGFAAGNGTTYELG